MRQFNALVFTLILLLGVTLVLRELDLQDRRANAPKMITVYVCGAVVSEGVVTLPAEARRIHAVELCGGLTPEADPAAFGPAEHLTDGETVKVPGKAFAPSPGESPPAREHTASALEQTTSPPTESTAEAWSREPPAGTPPLRLDINRATAAELEHLPGIGPVMARRIVETRRSLPGGSFRSLEDLTAIRGIKGKTLARLKPYLEPEGL